MTTPQTHSLIQHQNIGDSFSGIYYVENAFVKQTVHQKDYLDLHLRDRSGSRAVKYWGTLAGLQKGDWLFIAANVEDYQGNPSLVAKNIEKADEPADLTEYIPAYDDVDPASFTELRKLLQEFEAKAGDGTAGMLVDEVYGNAAFAAKFEVAPGSDKPHYGRRGGLLASTVRVANGSIASPDFERLTDYEKVVLLSSALLCRIGAIDSFEFQDCMPVVTKRGLLLGLNNLTMTRVSSALKRVILALKKQSKAADQDVVIRILHAVSSFSSCEGADLLPMTKEALILNAANRSDEEVVTALDFIENDTNEGDEFTAFDRATKRRFYTG
jgi:23S rRNA maturation-related 3'-5' exoribonuclease YhaM